MKMICKRIVYETKRYAVICGRQEERRRGE